MLLLLCWCHCCFWSFLVWPADAFIRILFWNFFSLVTFFSSFGQNFLVFWFFSNRWISKVKKNGSYLKQKKLTKNQYAKIGYSCYYLFVYYDQCLDFETNIRPSFTDAFPNVVWDCLMSFFAYSIFSSFPVSIKDLYSWL